MTTISVPCNSPDIQDYLSDYKGLDPRDAVLNMIMDNPSVQCFSLNGGNIWSVRVIEFERTGADDIQQESEKSVYRTRNKASQVAEMPKMLAVITQKDYQYALTFKKDEQAHLELVREADKLHYHDGELCFDNVPINRIDMKLYCTDDGISAIDIPQLLALYSVVWKDLETQKQELIATGSETKYIGHTIKMYLPDFLRMLGKPPNLRQDDFADVIAKLQSYSSVIGIIEDRMGSQVSRSAYPVMVFHGYNGGENTIYFASPYINMLIIKNLRASMKRDKHDNPMLSKNMQQIFLPNHSYLIKPEIAKERNKRAVEIIRAVVVLIEQAGAHTPHINAKTLVDRCPELKQSVEKATSTSDKNKILKRAFEGAWKLLPKCTELRTHYRDIKLPTPNTVPSMATLNTLVFEFPHKGKVNRNEPLPF